MNLMETNKQNMQRTTVRRASEHLVQCAVEEPKSVLRCGLTKMLLRVKTLVNSLSSSWEFVTSDYDISFGVYHIKEDEKRVEVVRHIDHHTGSAPSFLLKSMHVFELKLQLCELTQSRLLSVIE